MNRCRRMMNTTGLGGFYLDGSGTPQVCANTEHGCGYSDGSNVKGTLPILATRELMKALYSITRSVPRRGWILAHTSSTIVLPCLSFADAYLEGEHICGYPEIDQPLNTYNNPAYTLEGFRAQMMGHQFGIPAFYLKYPKQGAEAADARRCSAYALPHGMSPISLDHAPLFWKAYADFGAADSEWIPYWRNGSPLNVDTSDIKLSCYVRRGRGVLAVAANLTRRKIDALLTLDRRAAGLTGELEIRDLAGDTVRRLDADSARVELEPGSYALIAFEKCGEKER